MSAQNKKVLEDLVAQNKKLSEQTTALTEKVEQNTILFNELSGKLEYIINLMKGGGSVATKPKKTVTKTVNKVAQNNDNNYAELLNKNDMLFFKSYDYPTNANVINEMFNITQEFIDNVKNEDKYKSAKTDFDKNKYLAGQIWASFTSDNKKVYKKRHNDMKSNYEKAQNDAQQELEVEPDTDQEPTE